MPAIPLVGERNSRSLHNIIMLTNLPPKKPNIQTPGTTLYNKTCISCRKHMITTQHFSSDRSRETFTIRHAMTCTSKNLIYMLFCVRCKGAQYIGETRTTLKQRLALHRSHIKQNKGTHVTRHFNSDKHTLEDLRCVPIEQIIVQDHILHILLGKREKASG